MILPGLWCTHQLWQCFCWGGNLHSNVIAHVWKSLLYKCIQHVQLASVSLLSVPSGGLSWFLHPTPPSISACVCLPYMEWLQLRGAWLAIWQIVCLSAVFPSIRGFLFSEPPTLPSKPSAPVHFHVDTQRTHRIKMFAHTSPHNFYCGLFTGRLLATLLIITRIQLKSIV